MTQDADVVAVAAGRVDTSHECLAGRTRQKFPEDFVTLRRLRMVPIMVQKISSLKTPLKAPLTKGVFKEVFLESLFSLQNQEWDPSTGKVSKVIFSQYAKGVFKEVFQRSFLRSF